MSDVFWFATCQPGAEPALKAEMLRTLPQARSALQRPGIVTWKIPAEAAPALDEERPPMFARCSGRSLGRVSTPEELASLLSGSGAPEPWLVQCFAADGVSTADVAIRARALAASGKKAVGDRELPQAGETVLDVIALPDHSAVVGVHVHRKGRPAFPGGSFAVEVPSESPSRAYAKIEEALAWSEITPRVGETALEIGAAPGGAAYALVRRGVHVVGVDPGAMDPFVLSYRHESGARVTHIPKALGAFTRDELPEHAAYLLVDVHLAPAVMLHKIRRLFPPLRDRSLKAVFLTLKLNTWSMADQIPKWLEQIRGYGLRDVRARQLPSNRQEICVVGQVDRVVTRRHR